MYKTPSSVTYMRQCKLHKKAGDGSYREQTSWIPERFAKIGKILKLRESGVWDDGWGVVSVGGRETAEAVHNRSRYHLTQRQASDI